MSSASTSQISSPFRSSVVEAPKGFTLKFRELCVAEIGVKERGCNNCGYEVNRYQSVAKIKVGDSAKGRDGDPYCSAFFYERSTVAIKELQLPKSENPLIQTGLASAQRKHLEQIAEVVSLNVKSEFALLFWQYPNSISGHVDGELRLLAGNWIECVSPNSGGSKNQRDGPGVNRTYRNPYHPLGRMSAKAIIYFV